MPETLTDTTAETTADLPLEERDFAAYDLTYLRFVGGVHETKAAATKAAKAAGLVAFEIREV